MCTMLGKVAVPKQVSKAAPNLSTEIGRDCLGSDVSPVLVNAAS